MVIILFTVIFTIKNDQAYIDLTVKTAYSFLSQGIQGITVSAQFPGNFVQCVVHVVSEWCENVPPKTSFMRSEAHKL